MEEYEIDNLKMDSRMKNYLAGRKKRGERIDTMKTILLSIMLVGILMVIYLIRTR